MQKRPSARGNRAGSVSPPSPSAVFLVGFMGAGKTTVGRLMAERLGWEFTDLDESIESRQGRSVAAIFRDSGEAGFRDLEHAELRRVLAAVRGGGKMIAALGGGAIAESRNLALLRRHKFPIVFLDAPVETLRRRCLRQARVRGMQRPLLGTMADFRERHARRNKYYRQATLKIGTAGRRPSSIAAQLITALRLVPLAPG
jgi:shikimate kinase